MPSTCLVGWYYKSKEDIAWNSGAICISDRKLNFYGPTVIKIADMSEKMQQDAVDCATQALEKYNNEKDIVICLELNYANFCP